MRCTNCWLLPRVLLLGVALTASNAHASSSPQPPSSGDVAAIYLGCYVDKIDARRLPVVLMWTESWAVSVDSCYRAALAKGLKYFGVQLGEQCFGGNELSYAQSLGASTKCSMRCAANYKQICGGANANSVYQIDYKRVPPMPPRPPKRETRAQLQCALNTEAVRACAAQRTRCGHTYACQAHAEVCRLRWAAHSCWCFAYGRHLHASVQA